jgi:predicted glycogen debranching enzyme
MEVAAVRLGRDICGDLPSAEKKEWLITNGIGGYGAGTVAGLLTRRYHGLLIAALRPPLQRTLLLTKLDETVDYQGQTYEFATNRWADGTIAPQGYQNLEQFQLEGSIPSWTYTCADAQLKKQIWMQPGANTTYVHYTLTRASSPLTLSIKAFVNDRDHHHETRGQDRQIQVTSAPDGVCVSSSETATAFWLLCDRATMAPHQIWYHGFDLAIERYRGLGDRDDNLHAATLTVTLNPGETLTVVASTQSTPNLEGTTALRERRHHEQHCLDHWQTVCPAQAPPWIEQLVLAADQFIVNRPLPEHPNGKTIIAGYPWFGDWGRDTMISLPGLTLTTGRTDIARTIIQTFAQYLDQGMLPNVFPELGKQPDYNTVDAILWYFEAIREYDVATGDDALLEELYPALTEVIAWHQKGTRYAIHLDHDGLIYAGAAGVQLTWMDAKVGDWVVTPRIGKPIEINALWYSALQTMVQFAQRLGQPHQAFEELAEQTRAGFQRFWSAELGYCYDVLDGPEGNDNALRPNQIFAVSLPMASGSLSAAPLLMSEQQRSVVETCGRSLLTSFGLRSLAPHHPNYRGHYGGNQVQRDGVYHQGTTWGWLLGPYIQAHLQVNQDLVLARSLLEPMADHLLAHGLGSISEIFDGDAPFVPRGCFAQAWSVAETLRAWVAVEQFANQAAQET